MSFLRLWWAGRQENCESTFLKNTENNLKWGVGAQKRCLQMEFGRSGSDVESRSHVLWVEVVAVRTPLLGNNSVDVVMYNYKEKLGMTNVTLHSLSMEREMDSRPQPFLKTSANTSARENLQFFQTTRGRGGCSHVVFWTRLKGT